MPLNPTRRYRELSDDPSVPRIKTDPITVYGGKVDPVQMESSLLPSTLDQPAKSTTPPATAPPVTVTDKPEPIGYAPAPLSNRLPLNPIKATPVPQPATEPETPPTLPEQNLQGSYPLTSDPKPDQSQAKKLDYSLPAIPEPEPADPIADPPSIAPSRSRPARLIERLGAIQPPAQQQPSVATEHVSQSLPQAQHAAKQAGTTIGDISRTSNVQKALYPLSPLLQPEHKTGNSIVVSIADKKAIVYDARGNVIRKFPVYVGNAANPTPRGQFRIMENIKPKPNEWYFGPRWLGFASGYTNSADEEAYAGFHGWVYTKNDDEIERTQPGWKTSTHGCLQMSNPDVADLAGLVGPGDPVTVVDQPLPGPPTIAKPPKLDMQPVGGGGM